MNNIVMEHLTYVRCPIENTNFNLWGILDFERSKLGTRWYLLEEFFEFFITFLVMIQKMKKFKIFDYAPNDLKF